MMSNRRTFMSLAVGYIAAMMVGVAEIFKPTVAGKPVPPKVCGDIEQYNDYLGITTSLKQDGCTEWQDPNNSRYVSATTEWLGLSRSSYPGRSDRNRG